MLSDARFEFLSPAQLAKIYAFNDGQEWLAAAAGYSVVVLDRGDDTHALALERDRHARVLCSSSELVVFERGITAGR